MKVILSRKGFDGSNGGMPSMILPNDNIVSFPIPSDNADSFVDLHIDERTYDNSLVNGKSFKDIILELKKKPKIGYDFHCHIDPDLCEEFHRNKPEGWGAAFGQTGAPLSYLLNTVNVTEGDIFLFFGNYHRVEIDADGRFRYCRRTGDFYKDNDIQIIWGYLQVGKILKDQNDIGRYKWHPHSTKKYEIGDNAIFIPRDRLMIGGKTFDNVPGYGTLPFSKSRVLTAEKQSKSDWRLKWDDGETYYGPSDINQFNNRKNSSKFPDSCVYYKGIWQELALNEDDRIVDWARKIIVNQ